MTAQFSVHVEFEISFAAKHERLLRACRRGAAEDVEAMIGRGFIGAVLQLAGVEVVVRETLAGIVDTQRRMTPWEPPLKGRSAPCCGVEGLAVLGVAGRCRGSVCPSNARLRMVELERTFAYDVVEK